MKPPACLVALPRLIPQADLHLAGRTYQSSRTPCWIGLISSFAFPPARSPSGRITEAVHAIRRSGFGSRLSDWFYRGKRKRKVKKKGKINQTILRFRQDFEDLRGTGRGRCPLPPQPGPTWLTSIAGTVIVQPTGRIDDPSRHHWRSRGLPAAPRSRRSSPCQTPRQPDAPRAFARRGIAHVASRMTSYARRTDLLGGVHDSICL